MHHTPSSLGLLPATPRLAHPPAFPSGDPRISHRRRSLDDLLAPLDDLAARSDLVFRKPLPLRAGTDEYLPRYFCLGPQGGGDYLRLGIFATIHGDEPEGALALVRFAEALVRQPDLATGYALYLYPVCNPAGYASGSRHSRAGKDLNREFWKESDEPEVRRLETEIWTHAFHGIVTLHSDDTSDGLYGFVNGQVLSKSLLGPALRAAEQFLPLNHRQRIDGFPARKGIIYEGYDGTLRAVPGLRPSPFEITFETPQKAPIPLQVQAFQVALETILREFRFLMAVGQGI